MASLSVFSGPSSESEQVCVSAGRRGRWRGCKLIWVLRRFLTAFSELQVLGGSEGSANRSEIKPWASPITAISTTTLVPEDWRETEAVWKTRCWYDVWSFCCLCSASLKCSGCSGVEPWRIFLSVLRESFWTLFFSVQQQHWHLVAHWH